MPLILGLLLSTPASAATPVARALIAGGITAGGELVGGGVGAFSGALIGSSLCDDASACSSSLGGLFLGGITGVALGGGAGAALGGQLVHARPLRTLGFASIGLGAGITLFALGNASGSTGLSSAGGVMLLAGMPVGAGIAAATDVMANPKARPAHFSITPTIQDGQSGVRISGRF